MGAQRGKWGLESWVGARRLLGLRALVGEAHAIERGAGIDEHVLAR